MKKRRIPKSISGMRALRKELKLQREMQNALSILSAQVRLGNYRSETRTNEPDCVCIVLRTWTGTAVQMGYTPDQARVLAYALLDRADEVDSKTEQARAAA